MPVALISVHDKTGLAEIAEKLAVRNWTILASSGTARAIAEAGIPVIDIASIVGEPILGHRVVTLSREIHAGLLATKSEEDTAELERLGIWSIDLIYVNFYPLAEELNNPSTTPERLLNAIDVGGPAMVEAALKGERWIIVDRLKASRFIRALSGETPYSARLKIGLAEQAASMVHDYSTLCHEARMKIRLMRLAQLG